MRPCTVIFSLDDGHELPPFSTLITQNIGERTHVGDSGAASLYSQWPAIAQRPAVSVWEREMVGSAPALGSIGVGSRGMVTR